MSTSVFPTLAGLGWDVKRAPSWRNTVQENVSGKETRISEWTYPRWQWELSYDFLRQGTVHGSAYTEFAQLVGFFNLRQGRFDSFLYSDSDDYTVTGQTIGTGNGTEDEFQLIRTFGSFIEPVLAPNTVTAVKLNGVTQDPNDYTISAWGSATPGLLTFDTPPANGVAITADFTYYWPCRFTDDSMSFSKFMTALYAGRKVAFISLKN